MTERHSPRLCSLTHTHHIPDNEATHEQATPEGQACLQIIILPEYRHRENPHLIPMPTITEPGKMTISGRGFTMSEV